MTRKPIGRRKIPMEKIENRSRRDVTFSKRRNGVFKKADELTTICGAEVALVVFSPAGKVYSFGSPDVNTIVNRLTMGGGGGGGGGGAPSHGVSELNDQLTRIEEQLAEERKRGQEIDNTRRAAEEENRRCWWRPEYAGPLGLPEIGRLTESMEELKLRVVEQAEKQKRDEVVAAMNTLSSYGTFAGGGPYAVGTSLAASLNFSGAGPSLVNPNLGGADPYAAGPSWAIPLNFSGAGPSSVNPNPGGADPSAAGPSSAAPPNMNGGGSGF